MEGRNIREGVVLLIGGCLLFVVFFFMVMNELWIYSQSTQ